ncbi:MAG: 2OG-Fe dioxygenase family protein [Rhodospirillaceae bacterium]
MSSFDASAVVHRIKEQGFAFCPGVQIGKVIDAACSGEATSFFTESWNHLGVDKFLADGGRYRRRRFGVFQTSCEGIVTKPHQPHFQSRDYNSVNGGIQRYFEPLKVQISTHEVLKLLLNICVNVFSVCAKDGLRLMPWHTEIHQFRVETNDNERGLPTPEGMHRDGVDWVCVVLIKRVNVDSGVTEIFDTESKERSSFILEEAFDTVFLDDHRAYHGVTPITRIEQGKPAYRDILVVTFRNERNQMPNKTL